MLHQITDNQDLVVGKYYHCFTRERKRHSIELCQQDSENHKYLAKRIWAEDDNNQALSRWDIYGPIEVPEV